MNILIKKIVAVSLALGAVPNLYAGGVADLAIGESYIYNDAPRKDDKYRTYYFSEQILWSDFQSKRVDSVDRQNSVQRLTLNRLSRNGGSIDATLSIDGPAVKRNSSTGTYRMAIVLTLKGCVDSFGRTITSEKTSDSVSGILNNLRQSNFADYARCSLEITSNSELDRVKGSMVFMGRFVYEIFKEVPDQISLVYARDNSLKGKFQRAGIPLASNSEKAALAAANSFTSLVIDQYGDLLYSLSEKTQLSSEEKKATIEAYLIKIGPDLKRYLDTIDAEFPKLSLMTKLSILKAINDMYGQIATVEEMVIKNRSISLDKVIQRRL